MKQTAIVLGSLGSILFTGMACVPSVYAQTTTNSNIQSQVQSVYQSKYNELLQAGLSQQDAQYYAQLTAEDQQLKLQNKTINLANVNAIAQNVIAADPQAFRQKILNGDPSAIKAAFESKAFTQGMSDLAALVKSNPGQTTYTLQYPDGSKIVDTITPGTIQKTPNGPDVTPTSASPSSAVTPQGYTESTTAVNYAGFGGSGWQNTVKLYAGAAFAQVQVFDFHYTVGKEDVNGNYVPTAPTINGYQAGATSAGFIASGAAAKDTETNPNGLTNTAQGAATTEWTISSSVGISGAGLSFSVPSNHAWQEYAILRVNGNADTISDVAAEYS
ncbi:hypothetical protein ACOALA_20840 (plasmid) [Alicyclobacillus acidoterrestris]|uniref:hypothetical protein n=1 Tax=Alicyclobacillus acidoterrestris TaxID=1450 RepID=UPI003F52C9AC